MDEAKCGAEIRDAFFDQRTAVLVLKPRDGGSLYRSSVLEAVDAVCLQLEDAQTGWDISPRCITAVSLIEARKSGPPKMVILRDQFPLDSAGEARAKALATKLEFAIADTVDSAGTRAYVHLPLVSFDGVDLEAVIAAALAADTTLDSSLHVAGTAPSPHFVELSGDGPSARSYIGLYDAGSEGGLKEPEHLAAIERFQTKAEQIRGVAQTFSIVDDLKVTRQGLRSGKDEAFSLPTSRAEAAQLLLALSMSPATRLGPRLDGGERVGLLRVNLNPVSEDAARRIGRKLDALLAQATLPGARAFFCDGADGSQPES